MLESNPEAQKSWKKYQAEVSQIELAVRTELKEIVEDVKLLNSKDVIDKERGLLAEILLPLRYLIKHMAFKEQLD